MPHLLFWYVDKKHALKGAKPKKKILSWTRQPISSPQYLCLTCRTNTAQAAFDSTSAQLDPQRLGGFGVRRNVLEELCTGVHPLWQPPSGNGASPRATLLLGTQQQHGSTSVLKYIFSHTEHRFKKKEKRQEHWREKLPYSKLNGKTSPEFQWASAGPWGWINIRAGRKISRCSPHPGFPRRISTNVFCPPAG